MHVDKHLAKAAILIFACPQIDLVAADRGFLGIALAAMRQLFTLGIADNPLNHTFDHLRGRCRHRRIKRGRSILILFQIVDQAG